MKINFRPFHYRDRQVFLSASTSKMCHHNCTSPRTVTDRERREKVQRRAVTTRTTRGPLREKVAANVARGEAPSGRNAHGA
jgi:hypothetical protein